jgi:hypothetical protein
MNKTMAAVIGLMVWTAIWVTYSYTLHTLNLLRIETMSIDGSRVLVELLAGSVIASLVAFYAVSTIQRSASRG